MIKRWLYPVLAFIGIALIFGIFGGIKAHSVFGALKAYASYRPPPETVSATEAKQVQWRPYLEAIGTLTAVNGVNVSSELAGKVVKIAFHSGDKIKQGQLLVQLDDSQEQALLRQYEAQQALDKNNFERALAMRKRNLNSKQDLDTAREQYEMAQAQVAQEQAVIAKKSIRAPFAGEVGIRQINLGQYITAGQTVVNLEQLDPLHLTFTLPQSDVPRLHIGQEVTASVDAYASRKFPATITAINPAVNAQSRTVQVQATVPNPDGRLRPGMFADLKVFGNQTASATAVPATAITYSLYGDSVYVLEKEHPPHAGTVSTPVAATKGGAGTQTVYTAKQVFVKVGEQRADMVAVTGIKPGTLVVIAGQIKLHNGSRAVINNQIDLEKERELTP